MHKGKFHKNGRELDIYDSFDEVKAISPRAPAYCERCGKQLRYGSFFDNLGRFTLKGYCPDRSCGYTYVPSMSEETYEKHMLDRWTKLVKERAGYRCEMAGPDCEGELHAHHMIPKKMDPSRKYDVENGICLCAAHHKMIHSFM